jgi:hypothetical protein
MKKRSNQGRLRFQLMLLGYGNCYYIDRVAKLETAIRKKPRSIQINLIGEGEIPADTALLFRSVLLRRSPKTLIITNARSSLQGGSVLVWLLGDRRLIRDDARIFLRRVELSDGQEVNPEESAKEAESKYCDSCSELDPEDGDYVRMLRAINEFLPVKELAGRMIGVPVLRQFGLVENEKVDQFLSTAFAKSESAVVTR